MLRTGNLRTGKLEQRIIALDFTAFPAVIANEVIKEHAVAVVL